MSLDKVIVIGGGLAGLSAAHTVLENGGRVVLLDKNPFLGGNSTKATSGINGTLTSAQIALKIPDSPAAFLKDTIVSSKLDASYPLAEVMTGESGAAVEWLMKAFNLDLSLVSRLGGHSFPRTHRGKEKFPGMTITYALMEKLESICEKEPKRAKVIVKARVVDLLTDASGAVIGCKYESGGKTFTESGPVIIASGGYGADYEADSLLKKYRPDIIDVATTCGNHCTGDGIKMAMRIGAQLKDMEAVQVHPTGLVHPDEPEAKVKFLAAEALRGCGAIMLDKFGKRFVNELGRRDYVSGEMNKAPNGPYRLLLNGKASKEIEWHCKHYVGRKLMKRMESGADLAKEIGVSPDVLKATFDQYNKDAEAGTDKYDKKFFHNAPYTMNDFFHVAWITPVRHYTMGGLMMSPDAEVMGQKGPIPGLTATGEVMGGTHGLNRLGGSSLLDCVVFGRVSGRTATRYLLDKHLKGEGGVGGGSGSAFKVGMKVDPVNKKTTIEVNWDGEAASSSSAASVDVPSTAKGLTAAEAANDWQSSGSKTASAAAAPAASSGNKEFSMEDVAKHNKEDDCWVVVNGQVLDVTKFMHEHPGGKQALMLFAGRDATEEFNMLHKPDVVAKYAPDTVIGNLKGSQQHAKL